MTISKILFVVYLGLVVVMSLAAIIAYRSDKKKAERGAMRTKEKTLLSFAVFNGALGSLVGRILAHHKTDKVYFSVVIYASLVVQVASAILLGILAFAL